MALCCTRNLNKQCSFLKHVYSSRKLFFCAFQTLNIETDSIDTFTTQLLQNKVNKWNEISKKCDSTVRKTEFKLIKDEPSITKLSLNEINKIFEEAVQMEDDDKLIHLMKECICYKKCPSSTYILDTLQIFAQRGEKSLILGIEQLCNERNPTLLAKNSNFKHFLAEAIWVKGNIPESLTLFKEVYVNNSFLRRRIKLRLKMLIGTAIDKQSEAVLININNFATEIYEHFGDIFLLICVWQVCIISKWFTNQNFAMDMLKKNEILRKAVSNRIQYIVVVLLYHHRTEVVYRLLEILISTHMKSQYIGVLLALLDYQSKYIIL